MSSEDGFSAEEIAAFAKQLEAWGKGLSEREQKLLKRIIAEAVGVDDDAMDALDLASGAFGSTLSGFSVKGKAFPGGAGPTGLGGGPKGTLGADWNNTASWKNSWKNSFGA